MWSFTADARIDSAPTVAGCLLFFGCRDGKLYCLSATTYYKNKYNDIQQNAMFLEENTITFPCYDNIDVGYIVEKVRQFIL